MVGVAGARFAVAVGNIRPTNAAREARDVACRRLIASPDIG
jgi:hypothetical protein